MNHAKRIAALIICLLLTVLPVAAKYALDGQTTVFERELYDGVTLTNLTTSATSRYQLQNMHIVEFDPKQSDLYFNVVAGGEYANDRSTVSDTVQRFNKENPDLTPLAAVNGDLWMMASAHARVIGSGTTYGGYSDPVVDAELTLPRGFNIYDGELICSAYMYTETPYEGEFWSFGMTDDGRCTIGCPTLDITISDGTETIEADGLNRLPANDSLVVYTNRGCASNHALGDAYEYVVDMGGEYKATDGARLKGKVIALYDEYVKCNPTMNESAIILTARGSAVKKLQKIPVGSDVVISFDVGERYGRDVDVWHDVTNAVGGHMPFVVDGVKRETGVTTGYPSTILAIKNDGSVLMIADDGRQSGHSRGLDFNDYAALADELDINTGFILDGGGSTDLVALDGGEYKVMNKPSDGRERNVENTVILSAGPKRETAGAAVKVPADPGELTSLFFADDAAYSLLSCNIQSQLTKTSGGALVAADKYNGDVSVNVSFGLPQTTASAPAPAITHTYPSVDVDEYPYLVLDMKAQTADASALQFQTVYVSAGNDWAAAGGNFIGFNNLQNDGQFHRYIIDTTSNTSVKGQLNSLRIGYLLAVNGVTVSDGDGVVIRSLRLARTTDDAAALARYPFRDVAAGKWYTDAVGYCYEKGYMSGTSDVTFAPDAGVTRAMFATILSTMAKADLTGYDVKVFGDVPTGKWYSAPIAWATKNGLAAGIGGGKFGPNDTVTREQIATFLLTFAKYQGRSITTLRTDLRVYRDYSNISAWARDPLSWAVTEKLISGTGAWTISPRSTATRGQIALIVANYSK